MSVNQNNNIHSNKDERKPVVRGIVETGNETVLADFIYVAGSMFKVHWVESGRTMSADISTVKKILKSGRGMVTDPKQWAQITASILPDGSTETHFKDGTQKSTFTRTVEDLTKNGYLKENQNGTRTVSPKQKPKAAASNSTPQMMSKLTDVVKGEGPVEPGTVEKIKGDKQVSEAATPGERAAGGSDSVGDELARSEKHSAPKKGRDKKPVRSDGGASAPDGDIDEDRILDEDAEPEMRLKQPPSDVRKRRERLANDLNGDGVVDEFDDLIAQEQKKSLLVMTVFIGSILLSIVLFVLAFTFSNGLLHGGSMNPLDTVGISVPTDDDDSAQSGNSADPDQGEEQQAQLETIIRTDFDPETAVISYPMADSESEAIATAMIKMIKEDINNGDVNSFNEAVDIEAIAGQIAPEYAWRAAELQNLTELQRDEMMRFYHQTFRDNERQHVVNKDPYASIFGGRIREVRKDPYEPNKLYIVMESISGDHQRICFVMESDGENSYTISGITDAKGYVRMIQQGVVGE